MTFVWSTSPGSGVWVLWSDRVDATGSIKHESTQQDRDIELYWVFHHHCVLQQKCVEYVSTFYYVPGSCGNPPNMDEGWNLEPCLYFINIHTNCTYTYNLLHTVIMKKENTSSDIKLGSILDSMPNASKYWFSTQTCARAHHTCIHAHSHTRTHWLNTQACAPAQTHTLHTHTHTHRFMTQTCTRA